MGIRFIESWKRNPLFSDLSDSVGKDEGSTQVSHLGEFKRKKRFSLCFTLYLPHLQSNS